MNKGHIDVIIITESKLGNSFRDGQFLMEGDGAPFRLDWNKLEVVSCFLSAFFSLNYSQLILALKVSLSSLTLKKKESLFNCFYNPNSSYIESHLNCLCKSIDPHSSNYENIILLGYLNSCMLDSSMKVFHDTKNVRELSWMSHKVTVSSEIGTSEF